MARIEEAFTQEEFSHFNNIVLNGSSRIPICFCVDVSSSMGWLTNPPKDYIVTGHNDNDDGGSVDLVQLKPGVVKKTKLDDLKKVLKKLIDGFRNNPSLSISAVISIVTFSQFADTIINFCEPVSLDGSILADKMILGAKLTNVSEGINLAINKLNSMSKVLSDAQTESYKPVFIFITDGIPTDKGRADDAVRNLRQLAEKDGLTIIPIGIYLDPEGKQWLRKIRDDHQIFLMNSDRDFEAVFSMVQQLIECKAPIISVDEEIMDQNEFVKDARNIPITAYGKSNSPDDLLSLFAFPDGI